MDEIKTIRQKRFAALNKAQTILRKYTSSESFKSLKSCFKDMISSEVAIYKSREHKKAFFGNLSTCSSVWGCPVCSAKIQARRRQEIVKAIKYAYSHGLKVVMFTFTHPHNKSHGLKDCIEMHNFALRRLRAGGAWKKFKDRIGYQGLIRSNEVTHGANGWHWHCHELWFVRADLDIAKEIDFVKDKWYKSCKDAGFTISDIEAFFEHSIDVIDNAKSSDYMAKSGASWGADRELTGGASKKGAGRNPFDFLVSDDKKDELLFMEYVRATKGKCQMFWSPGLKDKVGIANKTDEELNKEEMDTADVVARLNDEAWKTVLNNCARAELLSIAEDKGFQGVSEWFADYGIMLKPPNDCECINYQYE